MPKPPQLTPIRTNPPVNLLPLEAGPLHPPGEGTPPFSGREPWPQIWSPWLRLEILSIKIMNRTGGDKGQPCRSPTCTGNRSDLLPAMRTKLLLRSHTETEQPLAKAPGPHTRGALPTEYHEGHGQMPSPEPQSTCGLVGQTPINPQAPCGGYRSWSSVPRPGRKPHCSS
ncbi:hypothetical protein L3Q82_012275 [Scortum barcoo]|uniref:Uncharacterized protein n=1 Tax=Scortum barcoo TaxID=214431 RepID=A0ACB8W3X9_9TELE|nr:hypothetical protein L3Q82_012275 [Scortum barcoo]